MSYTMCYANVRNIRSLNHEKMKIWGKMIRNMSYTRGYANVRIITY